MIDVISAPDGYTVIIISPRKGPRKDTILLTRIELKELRAKIDEALG